MPFPVTRHPSMNPACESVVSMPVPFSRASERRTRTLSALISIPAPMFARAEQSTISPREKQTIPIWLE